MPELILDRPIASFDLETTGLDVQNDRIVNLPLSSCTPTETGRCSLFE